MRRSKAKIRIKAISEGYDPTIGVMHDGSDGSSKFNFDLMEPERRRSIVPCWISSRRTSSIQRILSFGRTAYVDLTRKWRGCWWRGFRHRAARAGVDVKRPSRIATVDVVGGGYRPLEWFLANNEQNARIVEIDGAGTMRRRHKCAPASNAASRASASSISGNSGVGEKP